MAKIETEGTEIEFDVRMDNPARVRVEGEGSIAPALAAEICARPEQFYVNLQTTQLPAGAVRGQLR